MNFFYNKILFKQDNEYINTEYDKSLNEINTKIYNPLKAIYIDLKRFKNKPGLFSDASKKYKEYMMKVKEDEIEKDLLNEVRKKNPGFILNEKTKDAFEKYKAQFFDKNPDYLFEKHGVYSFSDYAKGAGKGALEFAKGGGNKIKNAVVQKIGEKLSGIDMIKPVAGPFFKSLGFDESKVKDKTTPIITNEGHLYFGDLKKSDGFKDNALNMFVYLPLEVVMKVFGSGALSGMLIPILGPIAFLPSTILQAKGLHSTLNSFVVELPEKLVTLLISTAIYGFGSRNSSYDNIDIQITDDNDVFLTNKDGVIIGIKGKDIKKEYPDIYDELTELKEKAKTLKSTEELEELSEKVSELKKNNKDPKINEELNNISELFSKHTLNNKEPEKQSFEERLNSQNSSFTKGI